MASFAVHAQSDISITNITLVGGSNLCPSSSVSVTVTFKNEGATTVAINDDAKLILSNGVFYTETIEQVSGYRLNVEVDGEIISFTSNKSYNPGDLITLTKKISYSLN